MAIAAPPGGLNEAFEAYKNPGDFGTSVQGRRGCREAVRSGADIFRINMSHSTHEILRDRVAQIRRVEAKFDRPIGILADLQGPSCASEPSLKRP